jgi:hypothetical protein
MIERLYRDYRLFDNPGMLLSQEGGFVRVLR